MNGFLQTLGWRKTWKHSMNWPSKELGRWPETSWCTPICARTTSCWAKMGACFWLGEDGGVLLVDWPWASRGAAWYDALTVLVEARIFDPALDAGAIASSHRIFASASSDALTGALAGLAAYYVDAARRPEVPGLPTLRSYHAKQATACVAWLEARLG